MNIPKGWKLVPVEPDDEMVDAACEASDLYRVDFVRSYDAALAASPTPPAQEDEPVQWMVPHKMRISRNGSPFKEEVHYTAWWTANKASYVEDENGKKHFPYPLYTRPDTSELRKAAETIEISLRRSGYIGLADHLREALNKEKS